MVKSFKKFLAEAAFSQGSISTVISIIEKRATQRLGVIYRYNGKDGVQLLSLNGQKYESYLYFIGNTGRAFRVNTFRYQIMSIDIWKTFIMDVPPQFTIDVSELNSVQFLAAFDSILFQVKNPHPTEIAFNFLPESTFYESEVFIESASSTKNLLTEARRANPVEFFNWCKEMYPHKVKSMVWQEIDAVAKKYDVQVPGYVRDQKVSKTEYNVIPPGVTEDPKTHDAVVTDEGELAAADKKKPAATIYLKLTAQDPVSKKFIPIGDVPEAQDIYRKLEASLKDDHVPKEELEDPNTLFGHMVQLVEFVCRGSLRALLIFGGPGLGKTYEVVQTIKGSGLSENRDYVKMSGKITATQLYQTLFKWRDKGLVVFDDCDSMWGNEDMTNILKAVLDTSGDRIVTWASSRTIDISRFTDEQKKNYYIRLDAQNNSEADKYSADKEINPDDFDDEEDNKKKKEKPLKYPSSFPFDGSVIFISNLDKKEFDTAILSRSAKIDMTLTPDQIFIRLKTLLPVLGGSDISIDKKEELLEVLKGNFRKGQLVQLTMREFVKGLAIVRSGAPNWKELLKYA